MLDLQEGSFIAQQPLHPHFLEGKPAQVISQVLKVMQPEELEQIKLNSETRRKILFPLESFYALHIQDFGVMRTLPVFVTLLS